MAKKKRARRGRVTCIVPGCECAGPLKPRVQHVDLSDQLRRRTGEAETLRWNGTPPTVEAQMGYVQVYGAPVKLTPAAARKLARLKARAQRENGKLLADLEACIGASPSLQSPETPADAARRMLAEAYGVRELRDWCCSECGCTDGKACEGGCWWITPSLCSACATPPHRKPGASFKGMLPAAAKALGDLLPGSARVRRPRKRRR
jgi:hypothetical protein